MIEETARSLRPVAQTPVACGPDDDGRGAVSRWAETRRVRPLSSTSARSVRDPRADAVDLRSAQLRIRPGWVCLTVTFHGTPAADLDIAFFAMREGRDDTEIYGPSVALSGGMAVGVTTPYPRRAFAAAASVDGRTLAVAIPAATAKGFRLDRRFEWGLFASMPQPGRPIAFGERWLDPMMLLDDEGGLATHRP